MFNSLIEQLSHALVASIAGGIAVALISVLTVYWRRIRQIEIGLPILIISMLTGMTTALGCLLILLPPEDRPERVLVVFTPNMIDEALYIKDELREHLRLSTKPLLYTGDPNEGMWPGSITYKTQDQHSLALAREISAHIGELNLQLSYGPRENAGGPVDLDSHDFAEAVVFVVKY